MPYRVRHYLLFALLAVPLAGCIEVRDLFVSATTADDIDLGDASESDPGRGDVGTGDAADPDDPTTSAGDDTPADDGSTPDDSGTDDGADVQEPVEEGIPPLPDGSTLETNFSGLRVFDFELGGGVRPERSNSVVVDYVGYLPDGTIFDSGEMIEFPLSRVIEGFAEGIEGMSEGGRRRIVIPPDLGYGPGGNAGAGIGGEDTITFDVTLYTVR